ncbi:MAG: hypothetical protein HY898_14140 [Deltaproteobacteria bacterium]|nr:hypothetical protein [Deltaproteobacteria bacterium]
MNRTLIAAATMSVLALLAASAHADPIPLDPINLTVFRVTGVRYELTGRDLNGTALNGKVLDGHGVVGVSFDGVQRNGATMQSVWLDESTFRGVTQSGKEVHGQKFVGAVFTATLDDGDSLELRVDAMERGTQKWDKDVMRYTVSYETQNGRAPLCGVDASNEPIKAIALDGRWDLRQGVAGGGSHIDDAWAFTFACEEYAIAKCVNMGYKPWQQAKICTKGQGCTHTTLADLHQACTRMLRADYCGDGVSHTVDGTEISAFDVFGIRTDSDSWLPEAEWGPDGARCLVRDRIPSAEAPSCLDSLHQDSCGSPSHLSGTSLLISEIAP